MNPLTLLKIGLFVGGLAVGLLAASKSQLARKLIQPIGPRTDVADMTRRDLFRASGQFLFLAACAFVLFLLAGWILEGGRNQAPGWQVGTVAFGSVVLIVCTIGFAGKAAGLAIRAWARPQPPPDSGVPPIEPS